MVVELAREDECGTDFPVSTMTETYRTMFLSILRHQQLKMTGIARQEGAQASCFEELMPDIQHTLA